MMRSHRFAALLPVLVACACLKPYGRPTGPGHEQTAPGRPGQAPFGALGARLKEATFPILSANIAESETGGRPAWLNGDGTLILEMKGLRIGLIGLTTPSTPTVTNPVNVESLRFGAL